MQVEVLDFIGYLMNVCIASNIILLIGLQHELEDSRGQVGAPDFNNQMVII
ncbi:MAG: hypothetical protein Q7J35_19410 [Candidatus Methanoperedens sp.]|nr:hypothetical protein [Candidatus Methanoperedens sp.]